MSPIERLLEICSPRGMIMTSPNRRKLTQTELAQFTELDLAKLDVKLDDMIGRIKRYKRNLLRDRLFLELFQQHRAAIADERNRRAFESTHRKSSIQIYQSTDLQGKQVHG